MQTQFAFLPRAANQTPPRNQVNGAVTAAVTQITLTDSPVETECTIRVIVDGAQSVAWCFGSQAGLTVNNGVYQLGNTTETYTLPATITQISCIAAATGSTLRICFGDGA
jgi:hypothetical protein